MSAPQQPVHCPDFVPSGAHYARELMPKAVYDGTKIAKAQLPEGFQPTDYTVICGRGKENFNHVGNRRFRVLTSLFLDRYSLATSKLQKSLVVSDIIKMVRQAEGNFCRFQKGCWYEVGDSIAREKVGAMLRDFLHTQYRSSTKSKIARRRERRLSQTGQGHYQVQTVMNEDCALADDCSTTSSCWESGHSLGDDNAFDLDVF